MENLPIYVSLLFITTTLICVWLFYLASKKSNLLLGLVFLWLLLQGFMAYSGFYLITNTLPPRFLVLVLPPLAIILCFFISKSGRQQINHFDPKLLTYLHVVRVPVELVLWFLFLNGAVPKLMTFEGINLDMFSGISAIFVAYFGYTKHGLNKKILLAWNFICLLFLLNIVFVAVLSAPLAFQQLAFDQPNVAVFHFPFVFLPGFIVPVVLFSHLVCIRKLLQSKQLS